VKVVVTGGAGFIGANLCRALLAADFVTEVVALDNLSSGPRENLNTIGAELIEGDILDDAALGAAFVGADAVVHLAARPSVPKSIENPLASHDANATGTVHVLEAVRRHRVSHLVVASSSSVYGANPILPKHEGLIPMPMSPYAASKLATESYALAWAHSFGLGVLAFRFFNVFGPLQTAGHAYAAVIPAFVSAALAGQPLPIQGDGNQTRDFTFVDSVTSVITDALQRRVVSPTPVNLAFGSRSSLLDVVAVLEKLLDRPLDRTHGATRQGDVRDSQADQSRLRLLFPDIEPVSFEHGLGETVNWFAAR
jgi:UDP-glucose 4-epimerase